MGAARPAAGGEGPSYEELVETEGRPRLRYWLDRLQTEGMLEAAVVYGYFPCVSKGDDLIVLDREPATSAPGSPSRASAASGGCAWPTSSAARTPARSTSSRFTVVTMGDAISEVTNELFEANAYRDYLELHGLSVQLTEALAEYWHRAGPRGARAARRRDDVQRGSRRRRGVLQARLPRRALLAAATAPARTSRTAPRSSTLLHPERIGVELSEEFQLHPEQSTDAIVVHHPEAKYFNT